MFVSERSAPTPLAKAVPQPAPAPARSDTARLLADCYATGAFSSSLSLLPTLYELSGLPPEPPPRSVP